MRVRKTSLKMNEYAYMKGVPAQQEAARILKKGRTEKSVIRWRPYRLFIWHSQSRVLTALSLTSPIGRADAP